MALGFSSISLLFSSASLLLSLFISPQRPPPVRRLSPPFIFLFFSFSVRVPNAVWLCVRACARVCTAVRMCVRVEHRDGESRSRGWSLTYGKEKTRTPTAHTHVTALTLCAVVKLVYYERGGDDTDKPWELPGQSAPLSCNMKTTGD